MAAKKKSSGKTSTITTYSDPADGAFIYFDHPELKVLRVCETADEVEKVMMTADENGEYEDWVLLTVHRAIGEGGVGPFVKEKIRLRAFNIVAYA